MNAYEKREAARKAAKKAAARKAYERRKDRQERKRIALEHEREAREQAIRDAVAHAAEIDPQEPDA